MADRTEQTYTTPISPSLRVCPWNCRSELMKFIESAKKSIDIQAQYLEDPALITLVAQKAEAGVIIRIIVGKFQEL